MDCDNRGGHNRINVNEDFFKTWSPQMVYVLGFIYADGMIEDCRESSRTCYTSITNTDIGIMEEIRSVMSSNHPFEVIPAKINRIGGKDYFCKPRYVFRIGNKKMYADLADLGLCPKKSLIIELPETPKQYFLFFLRGYFDGDGCIHIEKSQRKLKVIFTSGSKKFLEQLDNEIRKHVDALNSNIYYNHRAFKLTYNSGFAKKLADFMYRDIASAPYLKYKHSKYIEYIKMRELRI